MSYRLPLIDDELLSRESPTAKVELTEADLRFVAVALSDAAIEAPGVWRGSERQFELLARRIKRVADDLRREARTHTNGAATADTAPRHDSLEVPR